MNQEPAESFWRRLQAAGMNREVGRRCVAAHPQTAIGRDGEQIQVIVPIAAHESEPGESGKIRIQLRDEAVVLASAVRGPPSARRRGDVWNTVAISGSSNVHGAVGSCG